jgi:hypothetical protein
MPTFSQVDILLNLVGKTDCEVLGGDDSYPDWDMTSRLSVIMDGEEYVVSYNGDVKVRILPNGHTAWT